jgi:hypothetical protein
MRAAGLLSAVAFISIGERIELLSYVWAGARERRTFTLSSSFCIELLMKIFAVSANPSVGGTRRPFWRVVLSSLSWSARLCFQPHWFVQHHATRQRAKMSISPTTSLRTGSMHPATMLLLSAYAVQLAWVATGLQASPEQTSSATRCLGHRGVACQTMVKEMKG